MVVYNQQSLGYIYYRLQAVKILVQSFTVCHGKWPCSKPVNLSYGELLNYLRGILFAYLIREYQQRYFIGQARLYYLLGFISYGVIRLHPEECNFDSGNDDMQTLLLKTTPMGITSHLNNIGIFQAHGILGILGLAWIIFTKLSMPDFFKKYLSTHGMEVSDSSWGYPESSSSHHQIPGSSM